MSNTHKQIRAVSYPVIMNGKAFDRFGLFEVELTRGGAPLRATMLRFVGYESPAELLNFWEQVECALTTLPTLQTYLTTNLDESPAWDGSLEFQDATALL